MISACHTGKGRKDATLHSDVVAFDLCKYVAGP